MEKKPGDAALAVFLLILICASVLLFVYGRDVVWVVWFWVGSFFGLALSSICDFIAQPKPVPERNQTEDTDMFRKTKEAIGKLMAPISIAMSYAMLAAFAVMFAVQAMTETVPLFGTNLHRFVEIWLPVMFWVWIGSSVLSGRWAPTTLVKNDRFSSFLAFWGIALIAAYNLVMGNVPLLESTLYGWFGIIPIAAFVDWWYAKSDNFRSSTLTEQNAKLGEENERLKRELAAANARLAEVAPHLPVGQPALLGPAMVYVALLGVTRLNPARIELTGPEKGYLVLTDDGFTAFDVDLSEKRVKKNPQ